MTNELLQISRALVKLAARNPRIAVGKNFRERRGDPEPDKGLRVIGDREILVRDRYARGSRDGGGQLRQGELSSRARLRTCPRSATPPVRSRAEGEAFGHLRITAPVDLAEVVPGPLVAAFLGQHPAVTIEVEATIRIVDLVGEGFDLFCPGFVPPLISPRGDSFACSPIIGSLERRRTWCTRRSNRSRASSKHSNDFSR